MDATLLLCTVRGCRLPLARQGRVLRCPRAHSFDRAHEGYWNLLQPQDRRSPSPGDRPAAVKARRRWLERGFADSLARELTTLIHGLAGPSGSPVDDPSGLGRPFVVLDAGCGEGTLVSRVFGGWPMAATTDLAGAASPGRIGIAGSLSPGTPVERPTTGQRAGCASPAPAAAPARTVSLFGIDLSVAAIRLAAKSFPWATWIVANADRSIPLADRSCDLVLSLFGRRNPDEFRRALKPGGHALVVVPGEDDLQELRAAIHGHAPAQERAKAVVAEFVTPTGASARMPGTEERFSLAWSAEWRSPALLDRGSMLDLLAITYRGSRHSESKRLEARGLPEPPRVTLSAQALLFRATS